MNPLIKELVIRKISVKPVFYGEDFTIAYEVDGFYKSGTVKLVENPDGTFVAHARYNETTTIDTLLDLACLNHNWWCNSRDRFEGWKNPDSAWIETLKEFNLIKEEIKTITTYS